MPRETEAPEWASYARERHEAEREAPRKGYPLTRLDEALEKGYQPGVDDQ